eukprot:g9038.t1
MSTRGGSVVMGARRNGRDIEGVLPVGHTIRHLGMHAKPDEAAKAFNMAAEYFYGPQTTLNPVTGPPTRPEPKPVRVPSKEWRPAKQQDPGGVVTIDGQETSEREREVNRMRRERRYLEFRHRPHNPLTGPEFQATDLPPLPPPSRASAGKLPKKGATTPCTPAEAGEAAGTATVTPHQGLPETTAARTTLREPDAGSTSSNSSSSSSSNNNNVDNGSSVSALATASRLGDGTPPSRKTRLAVASSDPAYPSESLSTNNDDQTADAQVNDNVDGSRGGVGSDVGGRGRGGGGGGPSTVSNNDAGAGAGARAGARAGRSAGMMSPVTFDMKTKGRGSLAAPKGTPLQQVASRHHQSTKSRATRTSVGERGTEVKGKGKGKDKGKGKGKSRCQANNKTEETSGTAQEGNAHAQNPGGSATANTTPGGGHNELNFEDLAEVVWAPKAAVPLSESQDQLKQPAGEAEIFAFLERVAPVHTETALEELFRANYGEDAAERVLAEKHGIMLVPVAREGGSSPGENGLPRLVTVAVTVTVAAARVAAEARLRLRLRLRFGRHAATQQV